MIRIGAEEEGKRQNNGLGGGIRALDKDAKVTNQLAIGMGYEINTWVRGRGDVDYEIEDMKVAIRKAAADTQREMMQDAARRPAVRAHVLLRAAAAVER